MWRAAWAALLAAALATPQNYPYAPPSPTTSGSHTFTYNSAVGGLNTACTTTTSVCTISISGTVTAGDAVVLFYRGAGSTSWIASATNGTSSETMLLCPSHGSFATNGAGAEDVAVIYPALGGETSIVVTLNANTSTAWTATAKDFSVSGSGSVVIDACGSATGASALTQTGATLSLTGTSDLMLQNIRAAVTTVLGIGTQNGITSTTASVPPVTVTVASTTPTTATLVSIGGTNQSGCNISNVTATVVVTNTSFTYPDTSCGSASTGGDWQYGPYFLMQHTSTGDAYQYSNAGATYQGANVTPATFYMNTSSAGAMGAMALK